MPLRDHFHSPLKDGRPWDALHGAWPTLIVMALNRSLPPEYVASPRVHLGAAFEVGVATSETDEPASPDPEIAEAEGGVATLTWAPPRPTLTVATDVPDLDEYAVFVHDVMRQHRIVAAVEIVSPSNKDRAQHRRSFVIKCAALLQQGVSVAVVDLVTTRHANLYGDLLAQIGQTDPALTPEAPPLYAAACRWRRQGAREAAPWWLEAWAHPLAIGLPLAHTLPVAGRGLGRAPRFGNHVRRDVPYPADPLTFDLNAQSARNPPELPSAPPK